MASHRVLWPAVVVTVCCVARAGADAVTLFATKDNTLYESPTGATSNGAGSYLFAGLTDAGLIRRGLIAFDVAPIPAGSIIESVTLRLHMSRTNTAGEPVSLHRVSTDWGEGTSVGLGEEGNGAPATVGDATWIHTFFASSYWGSAGGEFDPTASAGTLIAGNGFYVWESTPGLIADVQGWLDQPATNFGWMLVGNEFANTTAKRFDSRQHPDASRWPVLDVQYRTVPEPASACFWASMLWMGRRRAGRGLAIMGRGRR